MTGMTSAFLEILETRKIDVELADRLGLETTRRAGTKAEVLAFPFRRDGAVVRHKYWRPDPPAGQQKWSADKGGLRIPFNEDCLRDDTLLSLPVVITEGEFDCIAALQSSHPRTISVPDGAPPPGHRDADDLFGSRKYTWLTDPDWGIAPLLAKSRVGEIVLAVDGDENGAALLQDLTVLLGRYRCKYVKYPKATAAMQKATGRERCKDLNEVLQCYGEKGVRETLSRAEFVKADGVYTMGQLPPLPPNVFCDFDAERHRLLRENCRVRMGDYWTITGVPSYGKTTFANHIFCDVADHYGLRIGWASFEQEPQRDHRRALREWKMDCRERDASPREMFEADRWIEEHHVFLVPSEDEDPTLDWLFEKMELAAVRHGVKIFIIDPWNELEHDRRPGESDTQYIGRAIRRMKRFARAFQVLIVVIAHPTKPAVRDPDGKLRMPTLYDIADSAHWYNKSDIGIVVHREPDPSGHGGGDVIVKIAKVRYHEILGVPGEIRMAYVAETRKYVETERIA